MAGRGVLKMDRARRTVLVRVTTLTSLSQVTRDHEAAGLASRVVIAFERSPYSNDLAVTLNCQSIDGSLIGTEGGSHLSARAKSGIQPADTGVCGQGEIGRSHKARRIKLRSCRRSSDDDLAAALECQRECRGVRLDWSEAGGYSSTLPEGAIDAAIASWPPCHCFPRIPSRAAL